MPSEFGRGQRVLKLIGRRRKLKHVRKRANHERYRSTIANGHVRHPEGSQRSESSIRLDSAGAAEIRNQNHQGDHERIEIDIFEIQLAATRANDDFRIRYEQLQETRVRTNIPNNFDRILSIVLPPIVYHSPLYSRVIESSQLVGNGLQRALTTEEILNHTELFHFQNDGPDGPALFCSISQELILPGDACRQLKVTRSL